MSSSTSSSRPRGIFLRIFLAITLGMAAAMALIRVLTWANDVSGETILARVTEARAALPRILAEEDDLVMFFGSSMTQAGFSARQFDRELSERGVEVQSFNFGFGGLNPYFQDYLARRIREAFDEKGRRLELALLEFVPFQVTESRWNGALPAVDSFVTVLASPAELWEITKDDPERGVRMFNIRFLRDSVSAEMTTWHFGRGLRRRRPRSRLAEDEENSKRRDELGEKLGQKFDEEYPDWSGANWNYDWQGAGTIPEERSAETLATFVEYFEAWRHPWELDNDKLNRIFCCDIEELHFEEILIEAYIRIVRAFQQFSDHVEVVLLPRNTEWIRYTPEARERLSGVLDRIRRETGVAIRNWQELDGFGPEMFSDTTHLSRYAGDVAFTHHLVEQYAERLGEPAREGEEATTPSAPD